MRLIFSILILFFTLLNTHSQEHPLFDPPLKIPLYLSGNFGEIRPDHPHSGIDIKTQGVSGQKVYAAAEGYISRIKVQAGGYGYSLYIDHPNGYTTQYGHLSAYRADIDEYVKDIQYARQSFTVDIYPPKDQFKISRGDFIALSGNSGSSGGPHLHFEIRTSADQQPTNVLKYKLPVKDNISPKFYNLVIYPVSPESQVQGSVNKRIYPVQLVGENYQPVEQKVIGVFGSIGIGAEVFDYLDGSSNRCGIYTLALKLDNETVFEMSMDRFTFAESRYINAHADYSEIVEQNKKIHRLYRLPNDRFSVYGDLINNGVIQLKDSAIHTLKVIAGDAAGNSSCMEFRIRKQKASPMVAGISTGTTKSMSWRSENVFTDNDLEIDIPARSLYEDILFTCSRDDAEESFYSDWFTVGDPDLPLHTSYTLIIKTHNLPSGLEEKALIVEKDKKERIFSAGGSYTDSGLRCKLSHFGCFAVSVDTVAPVIKALNINRDKNLGKENSIRFTITDDLSGIDSYRGYIDNQWVLFAYDAKNNLLSYSFDQGRLKSGISHELELYVTDYKENTALYHTTFTW